ncbi:PH domain-containing protein [bacterium]|nr:PH domain-containing protein [bacterium]
MIIETQENEKVEIVIHRHWAAIINLFAFVFLMAILPIFLFFIMQNYLLISVGAMNLFIIGSSIYYMFTFNMLFIGWLDYYLDSAVITNERIIDIDQNGLFNRTVSELHFSKVQDATGTQKGIIQSFLDFGDVQVQSAGTQKEFILDKVPHPYKLSKLIIDLQQQELNKLRTDNHDAAARDESDGI